MSAPDQRDPVDRNHVEETAARWLMRREEPDWEAADQAELDAWLAQSMAHKAAFWRLEFGWRQADRIGSLGDTVMPRWRPFSQTLFGRSWQPLAIAASIALVFLGVGSQVHWPAPQPRVEVAQQQTITTRIGGRKRVPLEDGSRIELNTATVLRAAVTPTNREVWLDQGEAYFEVKHSSTIPFVVHAGPRTVTVLGTKFSVRRDGDKVTVSVVEGRVRVDEVGTGALGKEVAAPSTTTVTTGDIAIAEGRSTLVTARSSERVDNALAWRDGMLSFDQTSLADVATEFNRYNERKLVITNPDVASIRIGGTFQASNVDAFVRLLRDAYGLRVQSGEHEVKIDN
ncbi:MAG: FecR domain-containing protein [Pseudomonadota bacterium]